MAKSKEKPIVKITAKDTTLSAAEVKKAIKILRKNKVPHEPKKVTRAKVFFFVGDDGKKYELTLQQKHFAELFCQFSMNGVQAIIDAGYNVTNQWGKINYNLAAVMAKENLKKPNVAAYITTLLDRYGLTDENVDKQLLSVINQSAELSPKVKAIDIYYKKKGSYASDKNDGKLNETIEKMAEQLAAGLP